jgi:hypothetical protein
VRAPDFRHEELSERRPHMVAPSLASVRCIFVIHHHKPRQPGSDAGLNVTTNCTMRVLQRHGVDCQTWGVRGSDELFRRLEHDRYQARRPLTHVIVHTPNFISPAEFGMLATQWPEIEFVQLNHTGLAYQSIDFHGPQRIREVLELQQTMHNVKVAGNNWRFGWYGLAYGVEPLLLPNLFNVDSFVNPVVARKDHDPLRIGGFGEARPWKNQLITAMAAISIARNLGVQLELYINKDRWPQTWSITQARQELYANLPGAKLIEVEWQPWPRFRRTVQTMDLLINPSFDETFCCVVADGIAEGVPSVVSNAMEWCPQSWQAPALSDPASVAAIGANLLHSRVSAIHDGRRSLTRFVDHGVKLWIDYLTG